MDLSEFETVSRFMERYPDVQVVLTHGLSWRSFADENGIDVPDAVYDALPIDNPNFHVQLLFAIFFGGMYDYPMPQIRSALEKAVERLGADRLMWGTDIPMVMRFQTYRQSLDSLRLNLDFLDQADIDLICGGNTARLMGGRIASKLSSVLRTGRKHVIRHISAIAEVVDDVDAAVEFYRDVLGLSVDHQPGGGYATVEIPGVLHFSVWSRSAAAEATYGDKDCRRPYPARLLRGVRSRLGKRRHGRYRRARLGSRSAAEERVVGPSDEPLHAAQRNARRILGNAVGPSHQLRTSRQHPNSRFVAMLAIGLAVIVI